MRVIYAAALVSVLSITGASAADGPLASGKPAGVRTAQLEDVNPALILAGGAAIGIGIALAVADDSDAKTPGTTTPTTTGTSP